MQDSLDKVEDQLAGVIKELDEAPNLSEEDKAPLMAKLTELVQLHADIKEKWDTCKDRYGFLVKRPSLFLEHSWSRHDWRKI